MQALILLPSTDENQLETHRGTIAKRSQKILTFAFVFGILNISLCIFYIQSGIQFQFKTICLASRPEHHVQEHSPGTFPFLNQILTLNGLINCI